MGLDPASAGARRLLVIVDRRLEAPPPQQPLEPGERAINVVTRLTTEADATDRLTLSPVAAEGLGEWLRQIASVVALNAEERGGVLVHAALAVRQGRGVLLAGPGAVGKSTACERLPAPWRALCDDTTLVVHDRRGGLVAHPWPTWSCFNFGRAGGRWQVEEAVPLSGIFFLRQAEHDRCESVTVATATGMLVELAEQAWRGALPCLPPEQLQAHRLQRFESIRTLTREVPCHLLHASRAGEFWVEIEGALG
jgi:SynChlorMet cassette protein ScmC